MPMEPPAPGLYNVGSYQVSGRPYVTGSLLLTAGKEVRCTFPYVAKSVTVINNSSGSYPIRATFNATGSPGGVIAGMHHVTLRSSGSQTFNTKCVQMYVSAPSTNGDTAQFTLIAELTNIPIGRMYALTGSGLTD